MSYSFFFKKKNQKEKSSLSTDIICRVRIIIDQFYWIRAYD